MLKNLSVQHWQFSFPGTYFKRQTLIGQPVLTGFPFCQASNSWWRRHAMQAGQLMVSGGKKLTKEMWQDTGLVSLMTFVIPCNTLKVHHWLSRFNPLCFPNTLFSQKVLLTSKCMDRGNQKPGSEEIKISPRSVNTDTNRVCLKEASCINLVKKIS